MNGAEKIAQGVLLGAIALTGVVVLLAFMAMVVMMVIDTYQHLFLGC